MNISVFRFIKNNLYAILKIAFIFIFLLASGVLLIQADKYYGRPRNTAVSTDSFEKSTHGRFFFGVFMKVDQFFTVRERNLGISPTDLSFRCQGPIVAESSVSLHINKLYFSQVEPGNINNHVHEVFKTPLIFDISDFAEYCRDEGSYSERNVPVLPEYRFFDTPISFFDPHNGFLYPFDPIDYTFITSIQYEVYDGDKLIQSGTDYPTISFGGSLPNANDFWDISVKAEDYTVGKEIIFNKYMKSGFDELFQLGDPVTIVTLHYERFLLTRVLYFLVFATVLIFIVATFFIKEGLTYFATIISLLFGMLGIKQFIPLPSEGTVPPVLLSDVLFLLLYILLAVSGINFFLAKFLFNRRLQSTLRNDDHLPDPQHEPGNDRMKEATSSTLNTPKRDRKKPRKSGGS